jgi:hypothetical protein
MTEQFPELNRFLADGDYAGLRAWLERESRLPGPRANLALILAFADACAARPQVEIMPVLEQWLNTPISVAPVNTPAEFPVACAAAGVAARLAVDDAGRGRLAEILEKGARDQRWRTREGVVLGAQRAGERTPEIVAKLAKSWGSFPDPFLQRGGGNPRPSTDSEGS